jgi:hypothetical protein
MGQLVRDLPRPEDKNMVSVEHVVDPFPWNCRNAQDDEGQP